MINPKELRGGNWVLFGKEPTQIDTLDMIRIASNPHLYAPLPLTPERLEALGFQRRTEHPFQKFWQREFVELWPGPEGKNWWRPVIGQVAVKIILESVSDAQNFYFFLTRDELEYKP